MSEDKYIAAMNKRRDELRTRRSPSWISGESMH
jgi:hypothetical protein